MAFANPRLTHHLRVAHVFIYAGSCLLLLLVVSNLLLCQGVEDYAPYCKNQPGNCRIPLQSLFERATLVASNNYRLAREMFNEFNKQYGEGKNFTSKVINSCHTEFMTTPNNKEAAANTEDEALFRLVISLLHSWDEPLHQAVTELLHRNGASPDILARAKEIEDKAKVLLEGVEMIQKRVHPGEKKNEPYPVWSEKSSLTADDEDVRQTAFYRMFHCLHRDSSKISTYINLLKCRFTPC
uniref:Chorionic somatomammotropin hormone 1 n=1 Tax=Bos mutus grunniens TaxID=30521 RepID=A0A8B9YQB1_BOSMU